MAKKYLKESSICVKITGYSINKSKEEIEQMLFERLNKEKFTFEEIEEF